MTATGGREAAAAIGEREAAAATDERKAAAGAAVGATVKIVFAAAVRGRRLVCALFAAILLYKKSYIVQFRFLFQFLCSRRRRRQLSVYSCKTPTCQRFALTSLVCAKLLSLHTFSLVGVGMSRAQRFRKFSRREVG